MNPGRVVLKDIMATTQNQHMNILRENRLFDGLEDIALDRIAAKMSTFSAPKGRIIMQHGDLATEVFFLITGSAIGQLMDDNGRQILFTEITAGEHFGELAALDGGARSITISASADCTITSLKKPDFLDVMHEFPQIAINLATELGKRLRSMNERVFGLVVHDVETRVAIRLLQLAQREEQLVQAGKISGAPTHEEFASFIGSKREAVSRAIARFQKAGIIVSDRKNIVINNLDQLLDVANLNADR